MVLLVDQCSSAVFRNVWWIFEFVVEIMAGTTPTLELVSHD